MQRLRGSDAFAIYSETASSPFETLKVAIYAPAAAGDVPATAEIRQFIRHSIERTGGSRAGLRIVRVPFDLHHPVWVAAPGFSPDEHICEAQLPPPGGKAQLCDFLSELMSRRLRRDRPPWEIWIVRGLEGGRIAICFKVHHALADGKTVARLVELGHVFKSAADAAPESAPARDALPGPLRLVAGALYDLARSYTVELPHFYRHLRQARRSGEAVDDPVDQIVTPFSAPPSILNTAEGGSQRLFRYESVSLADFKALSRHFDCTINTLVLGVCSEALKRYLAEVDTVPRESLITAMPIGDQGGSSLKRLLDSDIQNNNLAVAILPLHQDIDDFDARIAALKRSSRAAIDHVKHQDGRRFDNYLDFLPGTAVRLVNAAMLRMLASRRQCYSNTIISNVPGPRKALTALDGRLVMEELLSVGNLGEGGHLNITVWSYRDRLAFSFLIRAGVLPQPDRMLDHLREVLDEQRALHLAAPGNTAEGLAAG